MTVHCDENNLLQVISIVIDIVIANKITSFYSLICDLGTTCPLNQIWLPLPFKEEFEFNWKQRQISKIAKKSRCMQKNSALSRLI